MTNRRRRKLQEWLGLQRERALLLASLRDLNQKLESVRSGLSNSPLPLDGYTIKLGGTDDVPGISGLWLENFIDHAIAERVVTEEEVFTT